MNSPYYEDESAIAEALGELKDHLHIIQNIEKNISRLKERLEYDDFQQLNYTIRTMSLRCRRVIEPLEEYMYVMIDKG